MNRGQGIRRRAPRREKEETWPKPLVPTSACVWGLGEGGRNSSLLVFLNGEAAWRLGPCRRERCGRPSGDGGGDEARGWDKNSASDSYEDGDQSVLFCTVCGGRGRGVGEMRRAREALRG